MVRKPLLCVVVLLAVGGMAIAGPASGQVATDDGTPDQEPPENRTATPLEPADDEGALEPLPDAVVENGSLNLTALYETHSEVLREEGYRITENVTVTENESVIHRFNRTVTAVGDENRTLVVANATFGQRTLQMEAWLTDDERLVRTERDGNVTYRRVPEPSEREPGDGWSPDGEMGPYGDGEMEPHHGGMMGASGHAEGPMGGGSAVPGHVLVYLDNVTGEFTVTEESVAGVETDAGAVTVTAPIDADTTRYQATGNVTLVISEQGVVRAARATAETAGGVTMTYALTTREVGVQSLDAPDWESEALEQVNTTTEEGVEQGP